MNNTKNNKVRLTMLDNVNLCLESLGDHVMHLVFAPGAQIELSRFRRALRLSLDAEPILGSQLVDSFWKPYWRPLSADELDSHEYCVLEKQVDLDLQIQAFLCQNMDCRTEPMVQAKLIRGQNDVVCLNVNCVPIDGRGLLIYLERLFEIYNQLATDPEFKPDGAGFQQRSITHLLRYFSPLDRVKLLYFGLINQWVDKQTANNWRFPAVQNAKISRDFYHYQFQPQTLRQINIYRKRNGFTFNDVLLAAFYHALQVVIKPAPGTTCCVLNTYDLRRYETGPVVDRVANYSSFVNCNVKLDKDVPFRTLIERVKTAMAKRKQHYPGATEGPFIWPIFKFLPFGGARWLVEKLLRHRGENIPVMTNVGVIDTDRLLLDGRKLQWLLPYAPLEYPPKLTVTLATVGEVITLSLGYSRSHFFWKDVELLFAEMERVILAECGEPSSALQNAERVAEPVQ